MDTTPIALPPEVTPPTDWETLLTEIEWPAHIGRPVSADCLPEGSVLPWLWEGYIAKEHLTVLIGHPKAGKTTLLKHLLRLFHHGGELGGKVNPAKVLIISEEGSLLWRRRRDEGFLGPHVLIASRPFMMRPSWELWRELGISIAKLCIKGDIDLVIVDTYSAFNPSTDENDACQSRDAIDPLRAITKFGPAVLLVHHSRKSDSGDNRAMRGSSHVAGAGDINLALKKSSSNQKNRRILTGEGRYDETPAEVYLELGEDGIYRALGSEGECNLSARISTLQELLADYPGINVADLTDAYVRRTFEKTTEKTVWQALREGIAMGLWVEETLPGRSHKKVYRLADPSAEGPESELPPP